MKIFCFLAFLNALHIPSESQTATVKLVAAKGSSVLIPGMHNFIGNFFIYWYFIHPKNSLSIVEYYVGRKRLIIHRAYKERIQFFSTNASFLLMNVQEADSGQYVLLDSSGTKRLKNVFLEVFQLLTILKIYSNSSLVNSVIALNCVLQEREADSITWIKDGVSIPNEHYTLSDNNRTLIIHMAQESDSGIYTCIAQNPISQSNSSYLLSIKIPYATYKPGMIIGIVFGIACVFPMMLVFGIILVRYRCHLPPALTYNHRH
ncbi:pregnancy-specific glycoprotein 22-like [Heptranchias perlo]|uniref:pregnancy-specific glycoprotein 22-like n=1 Tax=Heptranchias perlo TaxID=212740 RepID=UPI00355A717D